MIWFVIVWERNCFVFAGDISYCNCYCSVQFICFSEVVSNHIILAYYCCAIFHYYILYVQIFVKWLCKGVDDSQLYVLTCVPLMGSSSQIKMILVQNVCLILELILLYRTCFDCQRQAFKLSELFIRSEDNQTTMPLYGLLI